MDFFDVIHQIGFSVRSKSTVETFKWFIFFMYSSYMCVFVPSLSETFVAYMTFIGFEIDVVL